MQKFKTSICKNYLTTGCDMGEACHFAHGEEDLRKVTDVSFSNRSLFRSIFMSFTSPRKLSVRPNQPTKLFSARTSQSLVNANLETDAPSPTELRSMRWNLPMFLPMLKEPTSIHNMDTNSTRPRPIFLSLLPMDTPLCSIWDMFTHHSLHHLTSLKIKFGVKSKPYGKLLTNNMIQQLQDFMRRLRWTIHKERLTNKVLTIANIND